MTLIEELVKAQIESLSHTPTYVKGFNDAFDILKKHSDWIPASSGKTPPKGKEYVGLSESVLIQSTWDDLYIGWYDFCEKEWQTEGFCFKSGEVIAWQPLPEPYKGE